MPRLSSSVWERKEPMGMDYPDTQKPSNVGFWERKATTGMDYLEWNVGFWRFSPRPSLA